MKKLFVLLAFLLLPALVPQLAHAQNCPGYPYDLLNGTTADATQVMANFNSALNCENNNLAGSGANTDITSLTGLTTPLGTAYGGTGNTTGQPSGAAGGILGGTYPNPTLAPCGNGTVMANISGASAAPICVAFSAFTPALSPCTGDTGSGGTAGIVPAPPSGSGAAGAVLVASTCNWQASSGLQPGMITMYASTSAPTGWLVCNGQAVSRTTYAALFAVVGTTFGIGDGSTTFNVPDFRGYFPRGWDSAGAVDPGRTFGTTQQDQIQSHNHGMGAGPTGGNPAIYGSTTSGVPGGASYYLQDSSGGPPTSQPYTSTGSPGTGAVGRFGSETRPVNLAINFIIKY